MSRRHKQAEAPMTFFSFQDIISCITGLMLLITILLILDLASRVPNLRPPVPSTPIAEVEALRQQRDALRARLEQWNADVRQRTAQMEEAPLDLDRLRKRAEVAEAQLHEEQERWTEKQARLEALRRELRDAREQDARNQATAQRLEAELQAARKRLQLPTGGPPGMKVIYVECFSDRVIAGEADGSGQHKLHSSSGAGLATDFLVWAGRRDRAKEYFFFLVRAEGVAHFREIMEGLAAKGLKYGIGMWQSERPSIFEGS